MSRRALLHALLLASVLLLAAALRFYRLDHQSLWNDEGTSVAMAQRDLQTIARNAAADIHPPLYYVLLSRWVRVLGTGEAAVRSLSALLGVGLVALTYALGRLLLGLRPALAAAFLAAISPFQVYYSQEARMYMLLAVLAAGAVLALARWVRRPTWQALAALVLLEAAGLWTHYSFAFVALALNLAFLLSLRRGTLQQLVPWGASQVAALLLFAPWLPVALRQAGGWPGRVDAAALPALADAWRWLVFGPAIATRVVLAWVVVSAILVLAGWALIGRQPDRSERPLPSPPLGRWAARWPAHLLLLWLGVPLALIFALGLYREAYLKFLLVCSPAVHLLLASALTWPPTGRPPTLGGRAMLPGVQVLLGTGIVLLSCVALRNYFLEPAYARDDYRGIASYVEAMGRPGDAILLNAPGQQEVFGYYYQGDLPVRPLPQGRPLDPTATEAALEELAGPGGRIFAVLWATDESDPGRFVEGWLDGHTYKALDSWYGNVRLALYAVPEQTPSLPGVMLDVPLADPSSGDELALVGYSLPQQTLAAGDIAQFSLFWQASRTPARRYKVFVHLLDEASHIVGQYDGEPGGGALLTTLWSPGSLVADHLGVAIHPATPPGKYRVEVGLYDAETGRRLAAPDGATQLWLEPLEVSRPAAPAPAAALGKRTVSKGDFGALRLLSYDVYRLGSSAGSQDALRPGDLLHLDLYWQADVQPEGDWQVQVGLVDSNGAQVGQVSAPPATGFPTRRWQAGDTWRGQVDLPLAGELRPGRYQLSIVAFPPGGKPAEPLLTDDVRVEAPQ
ncbi:MAG TPA: glycosyltransferase family 39 protein [Anaerolineae bacterium]|nr:glycosyltransferase family 39 protein [Anaerolineae bacterium]